MESALGDLFKYLLLCPEEVNLCAGPGCAFVLNPFSTFFAFPFLPLTLTQMMLPVLPIISPPMFYFYIPFNLNYEIECYNRKLKTISCTILFNCVFGLPPSNPDFTISVK